MPLGDADAVGAAGDVRARLRDAARLQRRQLPARRSPRAGTSRTIGMRLAVRVRSGVRWHDHRAFGVLDVQATIEPLLRKGNDAAALRAALADVASIELVTERTIRFVLKRPSDLVLRALCDVPILPDHLIRGVRVESAPIARAADRHGAVPLRGLGARQAHPPRTRARLLGPAAPASTRSCSTSTATPCARSTARGAARSTCCRACSTCTTRSRSSRRRCTAARRSTGCASRRYSFLVVNHAHYPLSDPRFRRAIAMLWDRAALRRRAAQRSGAPDRRPAARRTTCRRRRSIARAPSRCSRTPATATATPTACAITAGKPIRLTHARAGGQQAVQRRGARVRARDAQGRHPRRSRAGRRGDDHAAAQARRVRSRADDLAGDARRGSRPPLFGSDGAFNYGGYRSSALDALLDEARAARGPGGARADPGAHRAAARPTSSR